MSLREIGTAKAEVTPRYVQQLCEPYLPTLVTAGADVIPERRVLPHDHRCRCATSLMELATRVFKAMDVLETTHHARLCELKKEVLSAKNQVHDVRSTNERFSDGVALEELRRRLLRSEEENKALRLQLASSQAQVDALLQRLS